MGKGRDQSGLKWNRCGGKNRDKGLVIHRQVSVGVWLCPVSPVFSLKSSSSYFTG